jgi:gluconolactonase
MKLKLLTLLLLITFSLSNNAQTVTKLSTGQFGFIEGPVWDRSDHIYFSDITGRIVEKYSVSNNTFTTAFNIPSPARTNGLMFDKELNLIVCDFRDGNVTKRNVAGSILETYATGILNANDLCIDKKDGMYVSSPNSSKVYYISPAPARTLTVIDDTLSSPNGVIISNDGESLFVDDSDTYNIYKYDINLTTGLVSNKVVFATLADTETDANDSNATRSLADGMSLDTNENLYVANKKSIQIFNSTGTRTKIITFTENPTNCTFGGASLSTLYVTTPKDLYKIEFPGVTGFQHPFDLPEVSLSTPKNIKTKQSFNVFPNPSSNHNVTVSVGSNNVNEVFIYNELGQNLGACNFKKVNNTIEVTLNKNLKKNAYFLSIKTDEGETFNNKIVLQ